MGSVIDKIANIGQTSSEDKAATAAKLQAQGAQGAAEARERQLEKGVAFAQQGLGEARSFASQALANAQSPQELAALEQALSTQSKALNQQAELFSSIDPAIMEASKQALAVLRGGEGAQATGIAKRRQRERDKLVARLREQLGPGAETSTAGIQALNQFDQQTESLQQGSLGQLFGIAQTGAQGRGALNVSSQSLASIGGAFGNRASRLSNAALNAGQLTRGGFSDLINAQTGLAAGAGGQFVGQQVQGAADFAQAQQEFQSNANFVGQLTGGLLGPSVGRAGKGISNSIFGEEK